MIFIIIFIIATTLSTTAHQESEYSAANISEEEFNRLYGEQECLDSYFLPYAYKNLTYDNYSSLNKKPSGNQIISYDYSYDKNGKVAIPFAYDPGYGYDEEFLETSFNELSDIQKIAYFRGFGSYGMSEVFLAPWAMFDGENFYTWNDLMKLSDEQLNEINFTVYPFYRFISTFKETMSEKGLWKDEYESLYAKLSAHKEDYHSSHQDELYWINENGENIYLSEIVRECYGINGTYPSENRIYSFNPYTEEFSDWFISNADRIEESEFKNYMLNFCESIYNRTPFGGEFTYNLISPFIFRYPQFLKMPNGSGQTLSLRLLYEDYRDGIISKEQVKDALELQAFTLGRRNFQQYYNDIISLSWNEILITNMPYVKGEGEIILFDTEYYDRPDTLNEEDWSRWSGHFYISIANANEPLDDYQLSLIDNPERVLESLVKFRDSVDPSVVSIRNLEIVNSNIEAVKQLIPQTGESTSVVFFALLAFASNFSQ